MGKKRKRASGQSGIAGGVSRYSGYGEDDDDRSAFAAARGYVDPSTGQRGAFPGLGDYRDDGFFCGPASDGLDYLRMVRSEARGVPSLLVAKPPALPPAVYQKEEGLDYDDDDTQEEAYEAYEEGEMYTGVGVDHGEDEVAEDTRGWYEDGTYIGSGMANYPERPPSPNKRALLAWHDSFIRSFRKLRAQLHSSEPITLSVSSFSSAPNAVANDRPLPHRQDDWLDLLLNTSPTPKFLWRMDQQMVLKAFKINFDLLKVGADTPVNQTRWIYGLLLRCSEVMTPDEVYIVRDLGKRAIHIQKRLESSYCLTGKQPTGAELKKKQPNGLEDTVETAVRSGGDDKEDNGGKEGECEMSTKPTADTATYVEMQAQNGAEDGSTGGISSHGLSPEVKNAHANVTVEAAEAGTISADQADDTEVHVWPASTEENNNSGPEVPKRPILEEIATQRLKKKRKNRTHKDGNYPDYTPSPSTLGTLDMIISIVGDFFGQRDLLGERRYHSFGETWS